MAGQNASPTDIKDNPLSCDNFGDHAEVIGLHKSASHIVYLSQHGLYFEF